MFWNDSDEGSQLPFEDIDESKIKALEDDNNKEMNDISTHNLSKSLLKQLVGTKNPELYNSETPKLWDKELSPKTTKNRNYDGLFPTAPLIDHEDEVVKKSDKPMNKKDKNIQNIIEKTKWNNDDVAELEKQMLAVQMDSEEEAFHALLPPLNENSNYSTKNHQWNDVISEDLLNVHDSFVEDPEILNDPNIPISWPPLDPNLDLSTPSNAYNSRNFSNKYQPNSNSIRETYGSYTKGNYAYKHGLNTHPSLKLTCLFS